jgi:hypothetical protein
MEKKKSYPQQTEQGGGVEAIIDTLGIYIFTVVEKDMFPKSKKVIVNSGTACSAPAGLYFAKHS